MISSRVGLFLFFLWTGLAFSSPWNQCREAFTKIKEVPQKFYRQFDKLLVPSSFKNFNEQEFDLAKDIYIRQIRMDLNSMKVTGTSLEDKLAMLEAMTYHADLIKLDTKEAIKQATSKDLKRLKKALDNIDFGAMPSPEKVDKVISKLYIATHNPPTEKVGNIRYLANEEVLESFFRSHYEKELLGYGVFHYLNKFGKINNKTNVFKKFNKLVSSNQFKRFFDLAVNATLVSKFKLFPGMLSKYNWIKFTSEEIKLALSVGPKELEKILYKKYKNYIRADIANFTLKRVMKLTSISVALYTYLSISDISEPDQNLILDFLNEYMHSTMEMLHEEIKAAGLIIPADK